jgi:hypothetical protein
MSTQNTHENSYTVSTPPPQQPEHPISLKVMRLRKPDSGFSFPIVCESTDYLSQTQKTRYKTSPSLDSLGFHDLWTLPNSFGKIYVGETFTSYISLHNFSYYAVKSVSLKAELVTGNNRVTLLDLTNSPILKCEPGQNHDFIVEKPLSEQGTHMYLL